MEKHGTLYFACRAISLSAELLVNFLDTSCYHSGAAAFQLAPPLYEHSCICMVRDLRAVAALGKNARVGFSPQYGERGSASL